MTLASGLGMNHANENPQLQEPARATHFMPGVSLSPYRTFVVQVSKLRLREGEQPAPDRTAPRGQAKIGAQVCPRLASGQHTVGALCFLNKS